MEEEKVSITGLLSVLYTNKLTVLIIIAVFLVLGILIYITAPREYTSRATLIPTSGSNSPIGGLSSLASLAGINLSGAGNGGEINTASFEEILHSTPFLTQIVSNIYYFPSVGEKMSLKSFLDNHSKLTIFESIGRWPGKLASIFHSSKGTPEPVSRKMNDSTKTNDSTNQQASDEATFFENRIMHVDGATRKAINILSDNLNYNIDIRTGLIKLNLSLQDKAVVAKVMKDLIDEFGDYITDYERRLNKISLNALEPQVKEAKQNYHEALLSLAHFQDRNQDVVFHSVRTRELQLQEQLNLKLAIYNSLQQQKVQLQMQISDSISHVQVIEPPLAQTSPSRPRFILTILIALFLGIFLGATYVLSKKSVIQIVSIGKKDKKRKKSTKNEQEVDISSNTSI